MINKENFKLSIVIPCYNEKKTIVSILKKIKVCYKIIRFLL